MKKFKEVKNSIADCRDAITIKAFIKGLIPDTPFHMNLQTKKPASFEEVLHRADDQIEYEEDLAQRIGKSAREDEKAPA